MFAGFILCGLSALGFAGYNGPNELLKVDADGKLPALDGSKMINVQPSGATIPAGVIVLSLTSCPSGFSEVTALSGKFILGTIASAADVGAGGGANNITPTGTVSQPTFTGSAMGTHSHGAGTYTVGPHSTAADSNTTGGGRKSHGRDALL